MSYHVHRRWWPLTRCLAAAIVAVSFLPPPEAGASSRQFNGCESFIRIAQSPADPHDGAAATIVVEYGEITDVQPACFSAGPPGNFIFTINGLDRSACFSPSVSPDGTYMIATGSNVPHSRRAEYAPRLDRSVHELRRSDGTHADTRDLTVIGYGTEVETVSGPGTLDAMTSARFGFRVRNTGSASAVFTVTCQATGTLTCNSPAPDSIRVPGGADTVIYATAIAGEAAGSGTMGLRSIARGGDMPRDSASLAIIVTRRPVLHPGVPPYRRPVERHQDPVRRGARIGPARCGSPSGHHDEQMASARARPWSSALHHQSHHGLEHLGAEREILQRPAPPSSWQPVRVETAPPTVSTPPVNRT